MADPTIYSVGFNNRTERTWTMGIYQVLPSSPGLESVSWQQGSAPRSGKTSVRWTVDYNAAIADYFQLGAIGVYESSQILPTALGKKWKVVFNGVTQELEEDGSAPQANQIVIDNQSSRTANLGIGMSNQGSVFKRDVLSGSQAQFVVTPTYWAALFNDVVKGEVISSNITIQPLVLKFEGGITRIDLEAWVEGQTLHFGVANSAQRTSMPLSLVDSLLAEQAAAATARQQFRERAA
jgi:hypothetical protein